MIKKIMVPVDGSKQSVKAVELASDLASKYNAEIVLLHVLLRGHMSDGLKRALDIEIGKTKGQADNLVVMPQEILARVDRKGEIQLSVDELQLIGNYVLSSVAEISKRSGLSKITKRVEEGNPAKVIIEVADEIEPDMIVMGSRGLSNLQGILIGSVSHKVSQLAKCTCVTVR